MFKVKERFIRQGHPIYKIVDWDNQLVEGTFYQKELHKIETSDENSFQMDHVIKFRG